MPYHVIWIVQLPAHFTSELSHLKWSIFLQAAGRVLAYRPSPTKSILLIEEQNMSLIGRFS